MLVTLEDHLKLGPDGHIYAAGPAGYSTWSELLDSFDEVVLVARVRADDTPSADENRVEGPFISVQELPDYVGPWQYLSKLPLLRKGVERAVGRCDAYILRVPGLVGRLAWRAIRRSRKPYALDVVGDPWDALGPGTTSGLLRPVYRRLASRNMKAMCERSGATLYCSGEALPRRYPSRKGSYWAVSPRVILSNGYASAELMAERCRHVHHSQGSDGMGKRPFRLGFIGSFAQLYKGPDTLLSAVALCSEAGLELKALLVGEGRHRKAMENLARKLSVQARVEFLGQLRFGKAIFDFLDSTDLYVMPSRAEAFGRALLEAMARGCPCIGSNVGGIPELLAAEDLVSPGNPRALADKILEVSRDPQRLERMAQRNLAKAREFSPERLREVRRTFFEFVKLHSSGQV